MIIIELEPKVWFFDHASSEATAKWPIGQAAKRNPSRNTMHHLQQKNQPVNVSAPSMVCGQISCMDPSFVLSWGNSSVARHLMVTVCYHVRLPGFPPSKKFALSRSWSVAIAGNSGTFLVMSPESARGVNDMTREQASQTDPGESHRWPLIAISHSILH
jgi:hypothetical protein